MLLPQSSAFAALKNRLNSVSAIGYLHIAPRVYVSQSRNNSVVETISTFQFHQLQKSTETHASSFSTPTNAGPSSFDRSSRLKGRDEGGIRWNELLEKFRSVQERARRAQRPGADLDDGLGIGDGRSGEGLGSNAFRDLARLQGPPIPVKDTPVAPVGTQQAAHKSKSSLGKFGRLGGAVSARPKR
jgi:vacuole morphology and inheritance protein 14